MHLGILLSAQIQRQVNDLNNLEVNFIVADPL